MGGMSASWFWWGPRVGGLDGALDGGKCGGAKHFGGRRRGWGSGLCWEGNAIVGFWFMGCWEGGDALELFAELGRNPAFDPSRIVEGA